MNGFPFMCRIKILGCVLFALFCGCQGEGKQNSTLTLLGENTSNLAAISSIANDFKNETGITLDIRPHTFEDAFNKANQDFANKTGIYDVVMQYNFSLSSFVRNRYIYNAEELAGKFPDVIAKIEDKLFPRAWREVGFYYKDPANPDAGLVKVGYPFASNTMLLVYNADLFSDQEHQDNFRSRFGYDLAAPVTWPQLRDVAEYFTQPERGLAGIAMSGATGSWLYYEYTNFLFSMGGKLMEKEYGWQGDATTPILLEAPEAVRATEFYLSLKPFNAGSYFTVDQFEQKKLMQSGNVAMAIMWSDVVPSLAWPEPGKIDGRFGYAPIPGNKSALAGGAFFINRQTQNVDAAVKFVSFMLQEESQVKMATRGLCSAMRTVYQRPEMDRVPYAKALGASLARGTYMLEAGPDADLISNILTKHLQAAWRGDTSAREALSLAKAEIEAERAKAYASLGR